MTKSYFNEVRQQVILANKVLFQKRVVDGMVAALP
jgi:hypothetical protein